MGPLAQECESSHSLSAQLQAVLTQLDLGHGELQLEHSRALADLARAREEAGALRAEAGALEAHASDAQVRPPRMGRLGGGLAREWWHVR